MAQLLDLANELLLAIIDEVRVEDIEAFTILNKRIHSLSQHILEKHRAMKKKYSVVQLSPWKPKTLDVRFSVHPVVWLHEALLNEKAASYATHLHIQDREEDALIDDNESIHGMIVEMEDRIYSMLRQCPYIQREELEKGETAFYMGSFDPGLALLLTLLPNLQSIFLGRLRRYTHLTEDMLGQIAKASQAEKGHRHVLSQLVSLEQTNDPRMYGPRPFLDIYIPFAGLPSARSVSGDHVIACVSHNIDLNWISIRDEFQDADGVLKTLKSGITTIKFTNSDISSSVFEDLLCRISALQNFEYEYTGCEFDEFEPRNIVNSLLRNAGHSLVRLHLTDENPIDSPDRGDNGELVPHGKIFIGSLREFQVLKTITVNNAMLIEKNLNTETGGKESFKIHRLVDLLPASIEKLSVKSHTQFCLPGNIFDGLVESKVQRFPKLEKIELDHFDPTSATTKKPITRWELM